jgi:hypothetical protein
MIKKLFILTSAIFFAFNVSNAQQAFNKGNACLNLGIGLGSPYDFGVSAVPLPSFNAAFEYGVYEIPKIGVITVGGFFDIRHTWHDRSGYKFTWTYSTIAARAAFHLAFLKTSKFDVYGGLMTGLRHESFKDSNGVVDNTSDNYLSTDAFVGGKIMFSKKFGVFGEAGYGTSYLKLGITLMF